MARILHRQPGAKDEIDSIAMVQKMIQTEREIGSVLIVWTPSKAACATELEVSGVFLAAGR